MTTADLPFAPAAGRPAALSGPVPAGAALAGPAHPGAALAGAVPGGAALADAGQPGAALAGPLHPGAAALLERPAFRADFERLGAVTLDPARHTSPDARTHSLAVARRARELAGAAGLGADEAGLLERLALVHDIGKVDGTGAPSASVERLPLYGEFDEAFVELVRYHDINLPWYKSRARGEAPSDRAWAKLARRVDARLLVLFMVADRVDCPGGWRANAPLVWFLGEARARGLVGDELLSTFDDTKEALL